MTVAGSLALNRLAKQTEDSMRDSRLVIPRQHPKLSILREPRVPVRNFAAAPAQPVANVTVAIIIPAYNEEESIAQTIESILAQKIAEHVTVMAVVVVPNNCTDRTVEISRGYQDQGVKVLEMAKNPDKKSGAMNAAWLAYGQYADFVFTMDADTVVKPETLGEMIADFGAAHNTRGAVCARYWAKDNTGLARRLQSLEYTRFDDARELRGWRVQVASGAAVLYRQQALREVVKESGRAAPWDTTSLIEDYALTLDLKALGFSVRAARYAHVLTDTPATFKELWKQRLRWGRGGVDECRRRGFTKATRRDIFSYYLFGFSLTCRLLWVAAVALTIIGDLPVTFSLIGFIPLAIFWLERVSSVWRMKNKSWKDRSIVLTMVVEDLYGFFLEACSVASIWYSLRAKRQAW